MQSYKELERIFDEMQDDYSSCSIFFRTIRHNVLTLFGDLKAEPPVPLAKPEDIRDAARYRMIRRFTIHTATLPANSPAVGMSAWSGSSRGEPYTGAILDEMMDECVAYEGRRLMKQIKDNERLLIAIYGEDYANYLEGQEK